MWLETPIRSRLQSVAVPLGARAVGMDIDADWSPDADVEVWIDLSDDGRKYVPSHFARARKSELVEHGIESLGGVLQWDEPNSSPLGRARVRIKVWQGTIRPSGRVRVLIGN